MPPSFGRRRPYVSAPIHRPGLGAFVQCTTSTPVQCSLPLTPALLAQDCSRFGRKHLGPFLIFSLLALVSLLFVSWFLHLPLLLAILISWSLLFHHPRILDTPPCAAGLKTTEPVAGSMTSLWPQGAQPGFWSSLCRDNLALSLPTAVRREQMITAHKGQESSVESWAGCRAIQGYFSAWRKRCREKVPSGKAAGPGQDSRGLPGRSSPSLCGPSSSMVTSPSVANGVCPHWKPTWAGGTTVTYSRTKCWSWVSTLPPLPGAQLSYGSHF